tara:strand:- start:670 stop:4056 length:3387 start_codon:yes stop_codon:yes gene_type:complete
MAITTRQNSLLVAEDWKKIYQTFKEADFQSYDFETLRKSMIDYLRLYYPEDFNDFIESSEFIALIDLIAFLGQGLAFRGDLNARENFIDTAERRESILKLVRLINYAPKRNIPASGLLKILSVRTTEPVVDSDGINLSGVTVNWNDRTTENWQEQYLTVLNAALSTSQRIGRPGNSTTINGIRTEEYEVNLSASTSPQVFPFSKNVEGNDLSFEFISATSVNSTTLYEVPPKPAAKFNLIGRTDGFGNSSANTGYFVNFKQGSLGSRDFTLEETVPNRVINVDISGINNTDVWVYRLDANGSPYELWAAVPALTGTNIAYNNINQTNRKIYQIVTKTNDQIDLVFGDGVFAEIPQGSFRIYYRTSSGLTYKITPDEMQGVQISMNYISKNNRVETLTLTTSLQGTVTNASGRETTEEIRQKAPQQYYTQNRIVTGEDYNIFPFTAFSNIVKVKAVNRTSSGISRYLDVIDSTGKYSSTNIYGMDGWFYSDELIENFTFSFSSTNDIINIIRINLSDKLESKEMLNFYYEKFTRYTSADFYWQQSSVGTNLTTGYFTNSLGDPQQIGGFVGSTRQYIVPGALIKFSAPAGQYFDAGNYLKTGTPAKEGERTEFFASVKAVVTDGTNQGVGELSDGTGPVSLNDIVPTGAEITQILAPFATVLSSTIEQEMLEYISLHRDFGLRYDQATQSYFVIKADNLDITSDFSLTYAGNDTGSSLDASWVIRFSSDGELYTVYTRSFNFIFESKMETRFYFDPDIRVFDPASGKLITDYIKILKINSKPDSADALALDYKMEIHNVFTETDGYEDTTKIKVTFPDSDQDGVPDNVDVFTKIVAPLVNSTDKFVFFTTNTDVDGYVRYEPVYTTTISTEYATLAAIEADKNNYNNGALFFATTAKLFYRLDISGAVRTLTNVTNYTFKVGKGSLYFQYRHNSPNNRRIDPSPSNIIDLYILTKTYDEDFRAWVTDSTGKIVAPTAPTDEELRTEFASLENYKPVSDAILFSNAKFKPLFGTKADSGLRAIFKVVKNQTSTVSDSEVKSKMISAINTFFGNGNWDFGDTFYFSELSTYLHTALSPQVASIVLVPTGTGQVFGDLYQVDCDPDEIFISAATVDNITIIPAVTATQLNQI